MCAERPERGSMAPRTISLGCRKTCSGSRFSSRTNVLNSASRPMTGRSGRLEPSWPVAALDDISALAGRVVHISDIDMQMVVGLPRAVAKRFREKLRREGAREGPVFLDLLLAGEPGIADAVDVRGGAPAVRAVAPVDLVGGGTITAVDADEDGRVDLPPEEFQVTRENRNGAGDVMRERFQQRARLAAIDVKKFRDGEVLAQPGVFRRRPRLDGVKKARQRMCVSELVHDGLGGLQEASMRFHKCQPVDCRKSVHERVTRRWMISDIAATALCLLSTEPRDSVRMASAYGLRSGRKTRPASWQMLEISPVLCATFAPGGSFAGIMLLYSCAKRISRMPARLCSLM